MRRKSKKMMSLSDISIRWITVGSAALLFTLITVCTHASGKDTVEDKYPGLSTGVLKSAKLEEMGPGLLLSADGFEVPHSWVKETLNGFPAEMRKQIEGSLFFLLEQDVTKKVIVRDAKIAGIPTDGRTEDQIIQSYLTEKTARITVSDEETKAFYEGNKELVGGLPYDQVKGSIQGYLIQQKRQNDVSDYIKNFEDLKDIRINRRWVKDHYPLALDNPVDRAKRSGKPTMVEFGAVGCIPCDRMQPILDKLRKKYPDRLNVVFVNVRVNQILGAHFGIRSIPVQVFYDLAGKEVFRHTGFLAETEVHNQLKKMGLP